MSNITHLSENNVLQYHQPPNRYLTYAGRPVQSCFSLRPHIACGNNKHCKRWIRTNCSRDDMRVATGICNPGGYCEFGKKDASAPPFFY